MPLIHEIELKIPMNRILARLQYKKGKTQINQHSQELLNQMIIQAKSLCEPAGIWEKFKINKQKNSQIKLGDNLIIQSHKVAELLKNCSSVYLLACTIGPALSEHTEKLLHETRTTEAAVLDAIGSELVEETAEEINKIIQRETERTGYKLTKRFSPGYGDWELSVQPEILTLLKTERISLQSSKSFILQPEKSVTALIGVEEVKESKS